MLVLTRRQEQSIKIGDNVEIMVLGFAGRKKVRLGIKAPKGTDVVRTEVVELVEAERSAVKAEMAARSAA